jgi:ParB-like chromosome segregation protein Spo0J
MIDGGKNHPSGLVRKVVCGTDGAEEVLLASLIPAKINDKIYKPVLPADVVDLAESIRKRGLKDALLVTLDNVIISGHRRKVACELIGKTTVAVKRESILSTDQNFVSLLVECNAQRVKSIDEQLREAVIRTSPDDAHNALLAHRKLTSAKAFKRIEDSGLRILTPGAAAGRSEITDAKRPMLDAAIAVLDQYKDYWPLTLRQIHYRLLTRDVTRNAKLQTKYTNTKQCYSDLSDLLTRARIDGEVQWESMHDPTRPRTEWRQWDDVGTYMREQIDEFMTGYKRNLLVSQPSYVELVVEKLTVQEIAERAAGSYHVPVGVGRGYTSTTSLDDTADRYRASGKDRMILLIAGDLDPEGENIAETWGGCLRDEHHVRGLTVVKVGVNPDQVSKYNLAPLPVKESSSRKPAFVSAHGKNVYELEAFEPQQLQNIIRDAIRDVLDLDLFREEQKKESEDACHLMAYRNRVQELFRNCST